MQAGRNVRDLFEDLRDGHNLLSLLEVLSGEILVRIENPREKIEYFSNLELFQPRERGRMRFHAIQNVETALRFLRYKEIKLVNIRGEDIVDGNPKLTLGLIWTIILHFQVGNCPLSPQRLPSPSLCLSLTLHFVFPAAQAGIAARHYAQAQVGSYHDCSAHIMYISPFTFISI